MKVQTIRIDSHCILALLIIPLIILMILSGGCDNKKSDTGNYLQSNNKSGNIKPSLALEEVLPHVERVRNLKDAEKIQGLGVAAREKIRNLPTEDLKFLLNQYDLSVEYSDPIVGVALGALAAKDPASFIEFASRLGETIHETSSISYLRTAYNTNREAVEKWVLAGEINNSITFNLLDKFIEVICNGNNPKKIEMILKREKSSGRLLSEFYRRWASEDPFAAITHAKNNLSKRQTQEVVITLLAQASFENAQEAYQMAEEIDPEILGKWYADNFSDWIEQDFTGACSAFLKMPPERVAIVLMRPGVVEDIADRNPAILIKGVSNLVFTKHNKPLLKRITNSIAKANFELAQDWVNGFPESQTKKELIENLEEIRKD